MSGDPHPKEKQLARGERRYRRKVASPREWAAIIAAKQGPCRVCVNVRANGHDYGRIEFHHLVARARGGDDVADNIVPVHAYCHDAVTRRDAGALAAVAESLSELEHAYIVGKLGDTALVRLFGVRRDG